jgi:hypothetical protein
MNSRVAVQRASNREVRNGGLVTFAGGIVNLTEILEGS